MYWFYIYGCAFCIFFKISLPILTPWKYSPMLSSGSLYIWVSSDAKRWLTGKDLMLGKTEGRRRGRQRRRWLDSITNFSMDMNSGKLYKMVRDREVWYAEVRGAVKIRTWLGTWTTTKIKQNKSSNIFLLAFINCKPTSQPWSLSVLQRMAGERSCHIYWGLFVD